MFLFDVIEFIKDPANLVFVIACAVAVVLLIAVFVATSASRAAKKKQAKAALAESKATEQVAEENEINAVANETEDNYTSMFDARNTSLEDESAVVVDNENTPLTLEMMPPIVTIFNKSDLYEVHNFGKNQLTVSAKYGDVEPIKQHLYEMFNAGDIATSDLLITNERHLSCLKQAHAQTLETLQACKTTTLDIVANGLKAIWDSLGQITGTSASEDIINRIYSKFCLGK